MLEKAPMGAKILSVDHRETPMGTLIPTWSCVVLRANPLSCASGMRCC